MTIDTLFLRKLLVAFVVGFAGTLLQKVVALGPIGSYHIGQALLVSVLAGAVFAGLRAALVLIPGVNLVPSDANPVVTKKS